MKWFGWGVAFLLVTGFAAVGINLKEPSDLGVKEGRLAPMPATPNAVSTQTEKPEKHIDPWSYDGTLQGAKACVLKAVESYGNGELIKDEGHYMHVVFKTGLMRYRDDVEFYFDEVNQIIHIRSASRLGYSDMGLNRRRYEELTLFFMNCGMSDESKIHQKNFTRNEGYVYD